MVGYGLLEVSIFNLRAIVIQVLAKWILLAPLSCMVLVYGGWFHNISFALNHGSTFSINKSIFAMVLLALVKYLVLISLLCLILCSR